MASRTDKGALAKSARRAEAQLREMVALTLRGDLTRNQRTALETCITVHMHQKETSGAAVLAEGHVWHFLSHLYQGQTGTGCPLSQRCI